MLPRGSVARASRPASVEERAAPACLKHSTRLRTGISCVSPPDARTGGLRTLILYSSRETGGPPLLLLSNSGARTYRRPHHGGSSPQEGVWRAAGQDAAPISSAGAQAVPLAGA